MHRAFQFRLKPTPAQDETLRQFAGATRFVYNLCLEQRRDFWRQYRAATGRALNFISQGREITALRHEVDWIAAVPSSALHLALRDLDGAFANFFSGRAGYPKPRRRGANDAFRVRATYMAVRAINRRWSEVRVPNLGWVKFRRTRELRGETKTATFSLSSLGWLVSFACNIDHVAPTNEKPAVGIDRGISTTLALSTGEMVGAPTTIAIECRRRRAQRVLARCQRGSRRRHKQLRRIARLTAKIQRIRAAWQHRVSHDIASRFGTVAVENLNIVSLTARGRNAQKRGLNRSILEQGWGAFATKLAYKLEERGGALVKVNPAYTSQTCSDCGAVDRRSRESQASFVCVDCGFREHADVNAAINILRRSTASMPAEGSGYAPAEPGTSLLAA